MTTPQAAALQLLVLRAIERQAKNAAKTVAAGIAEDWQVKERHPVNLPDGTELGSVDLRGPKTYVRVADEDKLAGWCAEHYPTEVVTVTRVRPAFVDKLKAKVTDDGEVVPGLEVSIGDPAPTVTGAVSAAGAVLAAFQSGELTWDRVMPELEPAAGE